MSSVLSMSPSDVLRLGRKADKQKLEIFHTPNGDTYAHSATNKSVIYHTTPTSCDCPGFFHIGRCKHIAKLVRS